MRLLPLIGVTDSELRLFVWALMTVPLGATVLGNGLVRLISTSVLIVLLLVPC